MLGHSYQWVIKIFQKQQFCQFMTKEEKGIRLRQVIEHTGLSQKNFALRANLAPNYITNIVNGHKDLSGGVLEQIAEKFGHIYNIGWIISGKGNMLIYQQEPEEKTAVLREPPAPYRTTGKTLEERVQELERRAERTEQILEAIFKYKNG